MRIFLSMAALLVLGACAAVPYSKQALDFTSGAECFPQREQAVRVLGAWLDERIQDGFITPAAVAPYYAMIAEEDAKPDDLEDPTAIRLAEAGITVVIVRRLVTLGAGSGVEVGDLDARAALRVFNRLPEYGFDWAAWRLAVAAVPCS